MTAAVPVAVVMATLRGKTGPRGVVVQTIAVAVLEETWPKKKNQPNENDEMSGEPKMKDARKKTSIELRENRKCCISVHALGIVRCVAKSST